ncbi:MAG TPA: HAMP domain-containing sensor histidine kinase [Nocardioides sp.]|jgi:two-component system OmpR family sensor kinase|uniref:sensor histidine kinase n=1 Tax=Nocardioides sp. TaxID=35761 RepID=UPI002E304F3F|nr:HAMP domain-containing sensor histidine kinase [Nocardioides sp.]HEX3930069.1 HAMP domain-containing sensor histidine kinase [Nocardioides sp.]
MRRAFASLTSRLVVTTVMLVLVVTLLIGTVTTFAMRSYLTGQLDQRVEASLGSAQFIGEHWDDPPGATPPYGVGLGRGEVGTLLAWRRGGADGNSWVASLQVQRTSGNQTGRNLPSMGDELSSVPADDQAHTVHLDSLGSYRVVVSPDDRSAAGLPTKSVDDVVSTLIWWEVLLALLAIASAGGAATYVVRRQLRPLREVASTAHTVAGLPLAEGEIAIAPRVPEHLTDARTEVGQVGSALNTLLVHVESSLAQRHRSEQQVRQFVADASHELRTPLTTIAGYTELARRRPDDAGAVTTALGKVEEESARMTAMVEDLLLLARLDAGRPLARETVDLSRLLVEAVSDARVVAPDHRWRLQLPAESVEVTGDADRLHQVVSNLLANARKHTPAGTTVTVTGTASGFSVHDDGPGFPPDLAATAFERFVRGDTSRTRAAVADGVALGAVQGGAGLGLSLVHAIVTAHGGSVTLVSHPSSTTLTVHLPR